MIIQVIDTLTRSWSIFFVETIVETGRGGIPSFVQALCIKFLWRSINYTLNLSKPTRWCHQHDICRCEKTAVQNSGASCFKILHFHLQLHWLIILRDNFPRKHLAKPQVTANDHPWKPIGILQQLIFYFTRQLKTCLVCNSMTTCRFATFGKVSLLNLLVKNG